MSHIQNWCTATILVYNIEFMVKVSIPLYEARETLYAKSVVKEDKLTTGDVTVHDTYYK